MVQPAKRDSDLYEIITSRENRWLKMFRGALRGTGPAEDEPIAVEGPKLVEDALRFGLETEAILIAESAESRLEAIWRSARPSGSAISKARVLRTTDKLFASVAGTETPQGVAALFHAPQSTFEDILRGPAGSDGAFRGESALVVVLAGVQDPGNVGTIVRSAEAFGATGIVAARGTADPWSPKALRASAGSALRLPLLRGIAIPVLLAQLKMEGVKIFAAMGATLEEAMPERRMKADPDLRGPSAILIGSEGSGLPAETVRAADGTLSIPMQPPVESLNAGIAGSIVLFEAARQRRGAN
jgi:TrmH family RNA methyltransferase